MNIYLDINGVLLSKDSRVTKYSREFVEHLINKYPVYWLTTHCKGDNLLTMNYLETFFDSETLKLFKLILPTNWDVLKTDAIDFSQPFLWFDDYILAAEKDVLKQHNCLTSWAEIDLGKDENQLAKYLEI